MEAWKYQEICSMEWNEDGWLWCSKCYETTPHLITDAKEVILDPLNQDINCSELEYTCMICDNKQTRIETE